MPSHEILKAKGGKEEQSTLRRETETDMRRMNKNWIELEKKAKDRVGRRMLVSGLLGVTGIMLINLLTVVVSNSIIIDFTT
ncbi:unnamed protein product [Schistosoma margrebowiei]|uniref:Uncharacterized protein n=1 Tax=Schistosoma margrebowiei TaxID=48269 RepID=A0A183LA65_9TREM|nr:unnamed protein product [Schistosoma margrebowiei]